MSATEIWQITLLTLKITGLATILAFLTGIPIAVFIYLKEFPGKSIVISLMNTGMGLPPVVVGLFLALIFWQSGPLGFLHIIYTPMAMTIAQFLIAFPVIVSLSLAAFEQVEYGVILQAKALGASPIQIIFVLFKESRMGQVAAIIAAFGGIISEVGAVMMVGGNIKGYTKVLTTAIVEETRKGNLQEATFLAIILLSLSFIMNWILTCLQRKGNVNWRRQFWK